MRFASLGSGSKGNATVVQQGQTTLMIDCGFALKESLRRLERLGLAGADITAILVTHEHQDHLAGVGKLARKFGIPVYMTAGTKRAGKAKAPEQVELISAHQAFSIDDIEVQPFPVPHDAREPCQYVFSNGAKRFGVLSDVGHITPHIQSQLSACDALMLEANHCPDMLAAGPYPQHLKYRVGGDLGHLSNAQAAGLIANTDCSRLQHLVLGHISDQNNTHALALAAIGEALSTTQDWLSVACQENGIAWRDIA